MPVRNTIAISMKVQVIAAGSTKWERFIRRWGVSFLIGEDILFDTFGDTKIFLKNIRKFKVDTAKIKHIVLSHDDWDHISGLWNLIPNRKDITVYICPGFEQGIKERIASSGVKIIEAAVLTEIKDSVYSTGERYGESEGRKIYEQSLVVKTDDGLAVICGCAHPGVVNIVKHVKESFHADVSLLIGGFHLKYKTNEIVQNVAGDLRALGIRRIAPMHCTGKRATEAMRLAFGRGFIRAREGGSIEL